jgi:hypothetical protein
VKFTSVLSSRRFKLSEGPFDNGATVSRPSIGADASERDGALLSAPADIAGQPCTAFAG